MTLLLRYYEADLPTGGGIPDEVRRKAEELYSTKEYFNKWLKELVPHEKELVIDMMAELASEELARLKEDNERLKEKLAIACEQVPKYSLPDKPFQYGM